MTILSVDSSYKPMSAAISRDGSLMAECFFSLGLTHSETLMPVIDEMIKRAGISLSEIDALAVTEGPGSFTGLRIGSGTVKGLADALDIPVIPVPTLEVMAFNIFSPGCIICPMLDARRGNVYSAVYGYEGESLKNLMPQCIISLEDLLGKLEPLGEKVIFSGDAELLFRDRIDEKLKLPHFYAPLNLRDQRAGALSALAEIKHKEGLAVNGAEFKPLYIKETHAEEERKEAEKQGRLKDLSKGISVLPEKS